MDAYSFNTLNSANANIEVAANELKELNSLLDSGRIQNIIGMLNTASGNLSNFTYKLFYGLGPSDSKYTVKELMSLLAGLPEDQTISLDFLKTLKV